MTTRYLNRWMAVLSDPMPIGWNHLAVEPDDLGELAGLQAGEVCRLTIVQALYPVVRDDYEVIEVARVDGALTVARGVEGAERAWPAGAIVFAGLTAGMLQELAERGGAQARVSPFADAYDGAGLLQRACFALPVADTDRLTLRYAEPLRLLADLRGAGESNVLTARRRAFLKRATLMRALQLYRERFAEPDGRVPATFQFLTMTGWRPHESQQKPLKPGSGAISLTEALKPRG